MDDETNPNGGREARVWESTRTELVSRTCAWCGQVIGGGDPRRRYCNRSCRQRAYEVRTAERRRQADREAGRARREEEPVREVVRETTSRTVLRTYTERVHVHVPVPAREPGPERRAAPPEPEPEQGRADLRARAITGYLEQVAAAITERRMDVRDHQKVFDAITRVARSLDAAHPGGLEALQTR